jgi:hypothetical protein
MIKVINTKYNDEDDKNTHNCTYRHGEGSSFCIAVIYAVLIEGQDLVSGS